ncbi:addiction module protein [Gracilimonas mengyeensis]|uniref:Putative addiction module component, TIGR02574 family n=1 Tax=Gracilimonas mengyeensis TaxID=1302730 RepID=A0A521BPC0_9BACT|nr:addiction module protein [Gracilimonas mengyeensis]SMO48410.1 putative addiction module component, TIGR02574 family [Gracilimonas mengyeensis]
MKTEEIIALINDLPIKQSAKIATAIIQGLTPTPDPEVEEAWMDEVDRRAAEVDSGKVKMIPGEEFMKRLREITG